MIAAVANEKRRDIRHRKSKETFVVERAWVWNDTTSVTAVQLAQHNSRKRRKLNGRITCDCTLMVIDECVSVHHIWTHYM